MIQMALHWGGRVFATAYSREEVHALLTILDESQVIDLSRSPPLQRAAFPSSVYTHTQQCSHAACMP
jgi:hypothetical protein